MTGILLSIFGFIAMIGLLIFIHELGHFLVAKMFGVHVEAFSIGFVGSIVQFKWGETVYRIGWLPLGGYVKMLGEGDAASIPPELVKRSFAHKPLWQRSLIVLAGPLANLFVLPILALSTIYLNQDAELSTTIGTLIPGRPAQKAGLRPGDKILEVDGTRTRYFRDLLSTVGGAYKRTIRLKIQREDKTFEVSLRPDLHIHRDFLGTEHKRGIIGIIAAHRRPEVGISDPGSPAFRAGLRTWDVITAVDGKPIKRWEQLVRLRNEAPFKARRYTFRRAAMYQGAMLEHRVLLAPRTVTVTPTKDAKGQAYDGLHSSELFVQAVRPGTPLAAAGIRPGDQLLKLAGRTLRVHSDFSSVPRQKTRKYSITFARDGKVRVKRFKLKPVIWTDPFGQKHSRLLLGATLSAPYEKGDRVPVQSRLRYALTRSSTETWELIGLVFRAVGKLFTRDISMDTIGGPIMIFQIAKKAVKSGWEVFLRHMTLISINLGLLNLLPIPILDGGHLMFFLIEGVTRKPIPQRVRHWALLVGFVLLLLLMFIAFRNDLRRFLAM